MFCPKCAAQNLDGASYCRVCGANISLVPQALSGQLQQTNEAELSRFEKRQLRRQGKEVSLERAFKNMFMGIAFLLVSMALMFSRMGAGWWFWMLIPAFSMLGTGIAQFIRLKEGTNRPLSFQNPVQPAIHNPPQVSLPRRNTGELTAPPPSVTEGTTRHLGAELPTRHLDAQSDRPE
jgi:hypothetical protein